MQDLLSPRGLFYLVAVPENKPDQILTDMRARGLTGQVRAGTGSLNFTMGGCTKFLTILPPSPRPRARPSFTSLTSSVLLHPLPVQIVLKRRAGREHLHVLRFSHPEHPTASSAPVAGAAPSAST